MKIEIDNHLFKCKPYEEIQPLLKDHELRAEPDLCAMLVMFTLGKYCESPIEQSFFMKGFMRIPGLLPQVEFEKYRFDFGILFTNMIIELDGHDYHKTKEQRTKDAKRQRYLENKGFRLIRFTGSEIYQSLDKCISETQEGLSLHVENWQEILNLFYQNESDKR